MLSYMKTIKRDKEHRIWYGVAAVEDGTVERRVDDLTTDGMSVCRLLKRLNTGDASLIHFSEIVEDYLAQDISY